MKQKRVKKDLHLFEKPWSLLKRKELFLYKKTMQKQTFCKFAAVGIPLASYIRGPSPCFKTVSLYCIKI